MKFILACLMLVFSMTSFAGGNLLSLASEGDLEAIKKLPASTNWNQSDEAGETALIKALGRGNTELAKFLIQKKSNLNHLDKAGGGALLYAVSNNDLEITKLLIKKGASLETQYGAKKENILFEAARVGMTDLIEMVPAKLRKTFINQTNTEGKTPLFEAVANAQFKLAEKLLEKGADASIKTKAGRDLIQTATEAGVKEDSDLMRKLRKAQSKTR